MMEVSRRLRIAPDMVRTWRRRFIERGLDGLCDDPRPGVPRKITDVDVERVIVTTLEETPKNATHWSTRWMAAATGMSQSTVSRTWRAFALAPHRSQMFKLSTDPLFIDKVRDVVGLYLDPPEKVLVLCVDKKSQNPGPGPVPAGPADDARCPRTPQPGTSYPGAVSTGPAGGAATRPSPVTTTTSTARTPIG
ncbi:helix-turn-helix domain-containing protein [Streptomyces netropsis]